MLRKSSLEPASSAPAPFRALPMAEAHAEYGRMVERVTALSDQLAALQRERKSLEAEIAADTSPKVSPAVAALLGEEPNPASKARARLEECRREAADVDTALSIAERRKRQYEGQASKAICDAARPEMAKRMAALLAALEAADSANKAVSEVIFAVEAEGASADYFGPVRPHFLGGPIDPARQIPRFIRDAKEAGYGH